MSNWRWKTNKATPKDTRKKSQSWLVRSLQKRFFCELPVLRDESKTSFWISKYPAPRAKIQSSFLVEMRVRQKLVMVSLHNVFFDLISVFTSSVLSSVFFLILLISYVIFISSLYVQLSEKNIHTHDRTSQTQSYGRTKNTHAHSMFTFQPIHTGSRRYFTQSGVR